MLTPLILSAALLSAPARALDDSLEAKLDKVFAPWARAEGPGGLAAVIRDGEVVYSKGFGLASLEFGVPMKADMASDIGSISKQFTAAAILLLAEDGKLSLDDHINKHAPEIPTFGEEITIRHLLTHTSGLRDYLTVHALSGAGIYSEISDARILQIMGRQQGLNARPGEEFNYCNTGFWLAGHIVEKVSGKSLGDFCKERIFGPLGMSSTHFDDNRTRLLKNKALSYTQGPEGWIPMQSDMTVVGDGGLITTLADFAKWDANFYANKLGKGSADFFKPMLTPGQLSSGRALPYGFGMFLDKHREQTRHQHGGTWLGYQSMAARLPEKRITVLTFGNDGSPLAPELANKALDVMLGIEPEAEGPAAKITLTGAQMERVVGDWMIADTVSLKLFKNAEGALMLEVPGQPPYPVFATSPTELFLEVAPVTIKFEDVEGPFQKATFTQGAPAPMVRAAPFKPTAEQLASLAGRWHAPEIGATWVLTVKDDALMLSIEGEPDSTAVPLKDENTVMVGVLTIRFERDEDGKVTSGTMDAGRAKGMILRRAE